MSAGNERFNAMAAAWDNNPDVHRSSRLALEALCAFVPELLEKRPKHSDLDVLEIGCGTGLLTLHMASLVRRIVAVDAAQGMIDALTQKLASDQWADVRDRVVPLCILLEDPEDPALPAADPSASSSSSSARLKYDLVISHLVLHHIADHAALLRTLFGCLKPGGRIALTDYENVGPESVNFHPADKMAGVEHPRGIDAATFARLMEAAGFVDVVVKAEWTFKKEVEVGEAKTEQQFPFLLCRGRKP